MLIFKSAMTTSSFRNQKVCVASCGSLFYRGEIFNLSSFNNNKTLFYSPKCAHNSPTKWVKFGISSNISNCACIQMELKLHSVYSIWISYKNWKAVNVAHWFHYMVCLFQGSGLFKIHCYWFPQWLDKSLGSWEWKGTFPQQYLHCASQHGWALSNRWIPHTSKSHKTAA